MFLAVLSTIAWADESPNPSREGSVGFGVYQVPATDDVRSRGWPRANVHGLYGVPISGGGWRAGLHVGFQMIPIWAEPERVGTSMVFRFEPRVGYRIARNRPWSVDLMLGTAIDVVERLKAAPVLSLAPRVKFGDRLRTFVYAEGRIAPLFWGQTTKRTCSRCENPVANPGGSGLIVGIGRVMNP